MPGLCMLDAITPMVLTFNEVANIRRTIEKLRWATRILVIDSGSTDGTLEILAAYPQVEVVYRLFDSFADQCNFGLAKLRTDWVLSLDADYELSDELVQELRDLDATEEVAGYRASFVYSIYGRPLRGTLYPPRTVLYRVRGARYVNEGHGHRVQVAGEVRQLRGVVSARRPQASVALAGRAAALRTAGSRSSAKFPFRGPVRFRSAAKHGMAGAYPCVRLCSSRERLLVGRLAGMVLCAPARARGKHDSTRAD